MRAIIEFEQYLSNIPKIIKRYLSVGWVTEQMQSFWMFWISLWGYWKDFVFILIFYQITRETYKRPAINFSSQIYKWIKWIKIQRVQYHHLSIKVPCLIFMIVSDEQTKFDEIWLKDGNTGIVLYGIIKSL